MSFLGHLSLAARLHAAKTTGVKQKVSHTFKNEDGLAFDAFVEKTIRKLLGGFDVERATCSFADYQRLLATVAPARPDKDPNELGIVFVVNGMEKSVPVAPLIGQPEGTLHVLWRAS